MQLQKREIAKSNPKPGIRSQREECYMTPNTALTTDARQSNRGAAERLTGGGASVKGHESAPQTSSQSSECIMFA